MNWRLPILPLYVILIYFAGLGFATKTTDRLSEYCPVAHFENAHEHGFITHYSENSWYNDTEDDDHDLFVGTRNQLLSFNVKNIYRSQETGISEPNQGQALAKRFILFHAILI